MRLVAVIIILLLVSGVVIVQLDQIETVSTFSAEVETLPRVADDSQFARAYQVDPIVFPDDLGQHPDYKIEWWYYTGNLADEQNNRYGFQLTFFRYGLKPGLAERESEWGTNQIYFAHFTVTDEAGQTFTFDERFSRGNPGLAGAQSKPYRVWLDDWQALEREPGQVQLVAQNDEIGLDLTIEPAKPAVLHGDRGFSKKGATAGNASYYYSFTDNRARGVITTPRGTFNVTGTVWKDHEWSTSGLGEGVVGWDWFSLALEDGREVMYFFLRYEDNSIDPLSGGTVIYADGSSRELFLEDVSVTSLDTWTSPQSGATYPAAWQFAIPSENIEVEIRPLVPQQELRVSTAYWEGAVRITGSQEGYGYIEMTGYAGSMQGRL